MGKSKKKSGKCACCSDVDRLRKELRDTRYQLEQASDKASNYAKRLGESQNMLRAIRHRNLMARNKVTTLRRYGPPNEAAFRREMDRLLHLLKGPESAPIPRSVRDAKPITSSDPVDWDTLARDINQAWEKASNELGQMFREFRDAYNKKSK